MITKVEAKRLRKFLPHGYAKTVADLCNDKKITLPEGGLVTEQSVRNTLSGRENLAIEEVLYDYALENKKQQEELKERRKSLLTKKPEAATSGS